MVIVDHSYHAENWGKPFYLRERRKVFFHVEIFTVGSTQRYNMFFFLSSPFIALKFFYRELININIAC